ncbi:ESPR domain-containing protein, partial [Neisseria chenwenguii]|uniref:ESPR domain-containing protein n=1 Tax=Neisseria chenwenguii TaxID=1853278 RepID=UPI000FA264FB
MNKTLYKVIFNKKRGCLVVVAENVKHEGKSCADTQATRSMLSDSISGSIHLGSTYSLLSFSLSLALGTAFLLTAPTVLAQGIVADK